MRSPSVSVVILNWNGLDHLRAFLPSVISSVYPDLAIIVADNASVDGSVEFLEREYPGVRVIKNSENFGFAGGYNKALENVTTDYFVLLNSDVEVSPDWISPVVELMETDPGIAAAQPKILSQRNRSSFEYAGAAGGFIDKLGYPFCRGRIFDSVEPDTGQYDSSSEIFWASGAALFIKRDAWMEIGGFDEDFFAHMEEIDLCWRLKNKGYKIMYCAGSKVYHVGGGTLQAESPFKTYLNFRNNLVLIQKNYPAWTAALTVFIRLWMDLLAMIQLMVKGKTKNAMAISRAHRYFFINIIGNAKKSRKIRTTLFNRKGLYAGSIVWQYFVRKRKTFAQLKETF